MDEKISVEATYTSPNGRVRAHYRTEMTAEDDLQRSFIVADYVKEDGRAVIPLKVSCEWCLDQFCTRLELLDESGEVEVSHPYTRELLRKLTGPYSGDGWPASLSVIIYKNVLDETAKKVEMVKKTSTHASSPSTSDSSQPATPSAQPPTSS